MAGITLALAQAQLDQYLAAETAILGGQMYQIGERKLQRADLAAVQAGINLWNKRVQDLASRSTRNRSVTPTPLF